MLAGDEYLEAQVMTSPPHKLHLMVIDGAIRNAKQAREALGENNFEVLHFALNRSREFVAELISGLNSEETPELVDQLKGLFGFVYHNLTKADLERDVSMIDDALQILEMHRETWIALTEKLLQENINQGDSAGELQPPSSGMSWMT